MTEEKGKPPGVECLAAETQGGLDDASGLPGRLDRYSRAHHRALDMADYARDQGEVKTALNMAACGHYLLFRDYFTAGKVRLHAARFCNKHLLCPLCAIRRGAKAVQAYMTRLQIIQAQQSGLRASLVTLTVKNGEGLQERFRHLQRSFQRMQQARRNYLKGRGPFVELAKIEGAVGSYEFKRGKNSGLWHPHLHMVVLHRADLSPEQLSADWLKFTGDSHRVDITPFHDQEDPVNGFLEVFKYAVKFSDLPLEDNWHGFQTLAGKRLVFSFGLFWGVEVPEDLNDEGLDDLPFVELLYKFAKGSGYHLEKLSEPRPPARTRPQRSEDGEDSREEGANQEGVKPPKALPLPRNENSITRSGNCGHAEPEAVPRRFFHAREDAPPGRQAQSPPAAQNDSPLKTVLGLDSPGRLPIR